MQGWCVVYEQGTLANEYLFVTESHQHRDSLIMSVLLAKHCKGGMNYYSILIKSNREWHSFFSVGKGINHF